MKMKYVYLGPIDRHDAETIFHSGDTTKICRSLISISLYDPDYLWAQNKCLQLLESDDIEIKNAAITGFSHIARIHKKLNLNLILPKLIRLQKNPFLTESIHASLEEIAVFIPELEGLLLKFQQQNDSSK